MSLVLLRGALLWNGSGQAPVEGAQVLVEHERIKEVADGPLSSAGARSIDLGGRFLMPGLIDAHFHAVAADPNLAKLETMPPSMLYQHARRILEGALQRGFTTVRDAGGADYGLARAVESGLIAGPRIFYAGRALSQTGGHGDFRPFERGQLCLCGQGSLALTQIADGVTEVRRAAREELRKGASQIKIMASGGIASPSDPIWNLQYSEEEVRAAVWEARSWRTYVMAHAYTPEAIRRSVAFGVRSIEHGNLIDAETAAFCAREGAYVVPTLATYDAIERQGRDLGAPEAMLAKLEDVREAGRRSLEILKAAEVRTGFGTDLLGAMHDEQLSEFAIRAEVLSPEEILFSATATNAALLGRGEELGRVAAGARADLIALDGNPLEEISVLSGQGERIALIMQGGRIVKEAL
jgi:imidazolonepropionase-like amidohydrolase